MRGIAMIDSTDLIYSYDRIVCSDGGLGTLRLV